MSVFSLELDPHCGCTFEDAADEAIRVAKLLGITVECKINGARWIVTADTDPVLLLKNFRKQLESKNKHKFATG